MTDPKPAAAVELEALKRVAEASERSWRFLSSGRRWWLRETLEHALDGETQDIEFVLAANPTTVLALVAELEQLRAGAPEWIACAERMPTSGALVIFTDDDQYRHIGNWGGGRSWWCGADKYDNSEVTHWMPLPAAPPEAVKPCL